MKYSKLFAKTTKEAPKDAVTVNHKLLVRAGFVDQLMAGSWTLLPLGWRVISKIEQIIREEMNRIDGQEMLMPLLHPKEIWNETGRWETADEVMYKIKDNRDREFALSFTHEEIVMDLVRKKVASYNDLPQAVYHFSTKFRNELRATAGVLRGREFIMKDLYSMHTSEEDLTRYYNSVIPAYRRIFERVGLKALVTEASGGVFTDNFTHEFQVLTEAGEDTIYYCGECEWAQNKEVFKAKAGEECPKCGKGKIIEARSIEVGNIFPLGTRYAEKMKAFFTDKDGSRKPIWFGSYGIGITRLMGTIVELFNDERGIKWPGEVAPFAVHLVNIRADGSGAYEKLEEAGVEVLWDDTDRSAGEKLADADLIGVPVRLVVSEKTGEKVEWKVRGEEKTELVSWEEVISRLK